MKKAFPLISFANYKSHCKNSTKVGIGIGRFWFGGGALEWWSWAWRMRTNVFNHISHQFFELPTCMDEHGVSWIWEHNSHRFVYCLDFTSSALVCPRKHNWSKPGSGSNGMAPVCSENSSVWCCLSHSCGCSSLGQDKEQEGHTEDQLLSVLNLWLCNIF